jgi:hypothetical protein
MTLITSASDPALHASLVAERDKYTSEAGWVWYNQQQYIVIWITSGEIAFKLLDSEDMAKSTSGV